MHRTLASCVCIALACSPLHARDSDPESKHDSADEPDLPRFLKDESQTTAGFITVKGINSGIARLEYEYSIPLKDANEMLERLEARPAKSQNWAR